MLTGPNKKYSYIFFWETVGGGDFFTPKNFLACPYKYFLGRKFQGCYWRCSKTQGELFCKLVCYTIQNIHTIVFANMRDGDISNLLVLQNRR
jgi:hypothetical protein